MPAELIARLKEAFAKRKRGGKLRGVDEGRYVYGRLNNMGAMHGNKETAKGMAMESKYERDHGKR